MARHESTGVAGDCAARWALIVTADVGRIEIVRCAWDRYSEGGVEAGTPLDGQSPSKLCASRYAGRVRGWTRTKLHFVSEF